MVFSGSSGEQKKALDGWYVSIYLDRNCDGSLSFGMMVGSVSVVDLHSSGYG